MVDQQSHKILYIPPYFVYYYQHNRLCFKLAAVMESPILSLDETTIDDVLNKNPLVLLDFWAPWCGPCKQLNPLLEELATKHQQSVTVGKVNVDVSPSLAKKYSVRGIPTLILVHNGTVAATHVGLPSMEQLESMISEVKA